MTDQLKADHTGENMKHTKIRFKIGSKSSVFVFKEKRNLKLNDLNYYQERTLRNRLLIDTLIIRNN